LKHHEMVEAQPLEDATALGKGRRLRDGRTTLYNDFAFRGREAGADRSENNERSKMQGEKTGRVGEGCPATS
jgi:hypothetical protein